MRIAVFHELPLGGARRASDALTLELKKNHEVKVFQSNFISDNGVGPVGRMKHDFVELILLASIHWRLAQKIDSLNFDLVIVHSSRWTQAPFLLSFLRTPTVYYCHESLRLVYDPFVSSLGKITGIHNLYERINRQWRKRIDELNVRAATGIIVNSKFTQKCVRQAYGRFAEVCYLGVDTKLFHPQRVRKKYDILLFGNPEEIEGYDLLLAAKYLSKKQWRIKALSRQKNGRGVSDPELVKIINQAKVVVCLAHNEPFGLTVLEAMACGVPVVAVAEGGYKESVISGQTGLLVSRDPKKLVSAINKLLDNETIRKGMGKQGRQHVLSQWTWEKSGMRLEKLISMTGQKTINNQMLIHNKVN